jgi:hypothetical protein
MKRIPPEQRLIKGGRALFAVVGMKRSFAETTDPLRITQGNFEQAAKLEPELHQIVGEFLDGEREPADLPDFDLKDTEELLFRDLTHEAAESKLLPFRGSEIGDDFAAAATSARDYLQAKLPRRMRSIRTFGQTQEQAPPSRGELLTFRKHLATVEKPAWAVRNLLAATLGRDHIEALHAVWSDVLDVVRLAAETGIAERLEKDPDFKLSRRVARQLAVLLEEPSMPDDFVRDLQAMFANEPQAPAPRPTPQKPADEKYQTVVQRNAEQM